MIQSLLPTTDTLPQPTTHHENHSGQENEASQRGDKVCESERKLSEQWHQPHHIGVLVSAGPYYIVLCI